MAGCGCGTSAVRGLGEAASDDGFTRSTGISPVGKLAITGAMSLLLVLGVLALAKR